MQLVWSVLLLVAAPRRRPPAASGSQGSGRCRGWDYLQHQTYILIGALHPNKTARRSVIANVLAAVELEDRRRWHVPIMTHVGYRVGDQLAAMMKMECFRPFDDNWHFSLLFHGLHLPVFRFCPPCDAWTDEQVGCTLSGSTLGMGTRLCCRSTVAGALPLRPHGEEVSKRLP